ncbi:uncharacterized protein LOC131614522 [Vicia villosa]|uniref:uncharacterized protein LOC131614522 n=1 Tax=Vicia villosa TaxID=3911 RepID=UPI00273AC19D|nr:uncharacterized protein LOC131614522 [Vicia villosa]
MDRLIASAYDKVYIDLTIYGFSETFFPLRSGPPKDPSESIMCIGWLSKSLHFVEIYLKLRCTIPSTSLEWMSHSTKEAETWSDQFLERMEEFTKLSELERFNKEKLKEEPDVDLCGDASFDAF